MAPTTKIFSLEGKALKLDTAAQAESHLGALRDMQDVEEVLLQGNTIVSMPFADLVFADSEYGSELMCNRVSRQQLL